MYHSSPGYFETEGHKWLWQQRHHHRRRSRRIDQALIHKISPFFEDRTLEKLRIRNVGRIKEPPFSAALEKAGFVLPFGFRFAAGITFIDTIVLANQMLGYTDPVTLIFHEAVHAAQYRYLGSEQFIREYIRGWMNNQFEYHQIPIEFQAYQLQKKFEQSPEVKFSVEHDVRTRFHIR